MLNGLLYIIKTASITLPALEISILLTILSFCLVFHLTKIGLITAYLFIYRWGWIVLASKDQKFLLSYLILGTIVGIITAAGLIFSHQSASD
ncbi:MAG: hypothetical protein A2283_00855 [Lentisphaerae bacterium RIFOXYA12_FULL_48_11]|nr:MAG: hypothetical protein A2283_00855 [Lentisphaerae bacterium RIFOXYA12_FULL_48_11]